MIRRVLEAYGELHVSPVVRVLLLPALLGLLVVLVPLALVQALVAEARERQVLSREEGRCEQDHSVSLTGAWRCPACALVRQGHAFARCRCGARVAAVVCACSFPCRNPLWDPEEDA
ncbi:MAG: hypothetical protein ACOZNI_12060 [Myxococcota bacterium]